MKDKDELIKFVPTVSLTREKVNLVRVKCSCGHVLSFLTEHPVVCRCCGELVYPTKRCEFKNKLMKELRK